MERSCVVNWTVATLCPAIKSPASHHKRAGRATELALWLDS